MKIDVSIKIPNYTFIELNQALINSFIQHYVKLHVSDELFDLATHDFIALFNNLYEPLQGVHHKLILRDYHVDNLMFLENRDDCKKVGLLDIQDASFGFSSYDLVSLLEDARRDVSDDVASELKLMVFNSIPIDEQKAFNYSYSVLGMQRSLRILGLFKNISKQPGKERYSAFLPRVSRYIKQHLNDNIFKDLLIWADKYKIPIYD